MRRGRTCSSRGFTIVEMLVVTIIIAILAGIGTVAAYQALQRAKITRLQIEVRNLGMALEDYKNDFGEYPPLLSDQDAVRDHLDGRYFDRDPNEPLPPNTADAAQSLVFWLGPITRLNDDNYGSFSSDPSRPLTGQQRTPGRFEFDRGRLRDEKSTGQGLALYHYYPAGIQAPYVYFPASSYQNSTYTNPQSSNDVIKPYRSSEGSGNNYVEPLKYQIICAGFDGEYGDGGKFPSGPYDTGKDPQTGDPLNRGDDNVVNFYSEGLLGESAE